MSAHINCAECGIDFCMPTAHHQRLRESHETFYCPNGHRNHYPGKTDKEKRIETLERQLKWARDDDRRHYEAFKDRTHQFAEALRECPAGCGWRSPCHIRHHYNFDFGFEERVRESVALHLSEVHGAEVVQPDEAEQGEEVPANA